MAETITRDLLSFVTVPLVENPRLKGLNQLQQDRLNASVKFDQIRVQDRTIKIQLKCLKCKLKDPNNNNNSVEVGIKQSLDNLYKAVEQLMLLEEDQSFKLLNGGKVLPRDSSDTRLIDANVNADVTLTVMGMKK
ncbi:hypothetical protein MIR68_011122 [Amoeboaphelidium protococcarum]|nr:hypothetical protein MIR68_011122 [Amoeboaphelidium protococcarum]